MTTGYYLLDNRQTKPQCGYPRRGGAKASGTIILHDAEGGTDLSGTDMGAENVANYIRTRDTYGSYHRLVDRDTRIKMAPIDYETWHSVPDNNWSVGISVAWNKADLAKMTYAQRRSYYVPFALEVLDVREEFADRGIEVPIDRMLTAAETQARKPGISTHSRTDPSRRSDPFGTGSSYEREFMTVLAELAKNPTNPPEEPDMDSTDKQVAADTLKAANAALAAVKALAARRVVDGPSGEPKEQDLLTLEAANRRLLIEQRAGFAKAAQRDAAQTAVIRALAEDRGVDPDAVLQLLDERLTEAFANVEITLTTKEA